MQATGIYTCAEAYRKRAFYCRDITDQIRHAWVGSAVARDRSHNGIALVFFYCKRLLSLLWHNRNFVIVISTHPDVNQRLRERHLIGKMRKRLEMIHMCSFYHSILKYYRTFMQAFYTASTNDSQTFLSNVYWNGKPVCGVFYTFYAPINSVFTWNAKVA